VVTVLELNLFSIVNHPSDDHFTIVMSEQGFNSSKARYPTPWPIMNVRKGDKVSIHVENDDPGGEPHAFVITHYFASGIKLAGGQSDDISFTANQAGSFLVYCNILCTPHTYMLNGQLNVT
jgi:heme/copper-type cytochrome/quinol oxidase subunit 2